MSDRPPWVQGRVRLETDIRLPEEEAVSEKTLVEPLQRELCADCEVAERFANHIAYHNLDVDKLKRQLAEAAMRIEELEAQVAELKGICETAVEHIEAAVVGVRGGLSVPTSQVCGYLDAALNKLTRAR